MEVEAAARTRGSAGDGDKGDGGGGGGSASFLTLLSASCGSALTPLFLPLLRFRQVNTPVSCQGRAHGCLLASSPSSKVIFLPFFIYHLDPSISLPTVPTL